MAAIGSQVGANADVVLDKYNWIIIWMLWAAMGPWGLLLKSLPTASIRGNLCIYGELRTSRRMRKRTGGAVADPGGVR